jgi:hypothetical protein
MVNGLVLKFQTFEGNSDIKLILQPDSGQEVQAVSLWKKKVVILTEEEYTALNTGENYVQKISGQLSDCESLWQGLKVMILDIVKEKRTDA